MYRHPTGLKVTRHQRSNVLIQCAVGFTVFIFCLSCLLCPVRLLCLLCLVCPVCLVYSAEVSVLQFSCVRVCLSRTLKSS